MLEQLQRRLEAGRTRSRRAEKRKHKSTRTDKLFARWIKCGTHTYVGLARVFGLSILLSTSRRRRAGMALVGALLHTEIYHDGFVVVVDVFAQRNFRRLTCLSSSLS